MFERYAIFYTPPAGPLAEFGARWLGWDNAKGRKLSHPYVEGLDVAAITATPRKYGFHGTLKAPFRLAEGIRQDDLRAGVDAFAAAHAGVLLDQVSLDYHHGFVGLRPAGDTPVLNALVADIVRELDPFRAPLRDADIARRRRANLTPRQDAQMLEWGYPFIFNDFHFHLTLSGAMGADEAEHVIDALALHVDKALPGPLHIDAITLMGEDENGLFHQVHRAPFLG